MALHRIKDPDDLIECPYDSVHMVRAKRFPYHLMKCRRNYAGMDYATCPFNARHEFPVPERRYHIANCPDKAILEKQIAEESGRGGTMYKGCTEMPISDWVPPEATEDWETEATPVARIGIDERLLDIDPNLPRFKDMTGMKPSEKKEFKRRLLLIAERRERGECVDDISLDVVKHPVNPVAVTTTTTTRLPKTKPQVIAAKEQFVQARNMAGIGRGIKPPAQKSRLVANFNLNNSGAAAGGAAGGGAAAGGGGGGGGSTHRLLTPASFSMSGLNNSGMISFGRGIGRGIPLSGRGIPSSGVSAAQRQQPSVIIQPQSGETGLQPQPGETGQQPQPSGVIQSDEQMYTDSDRGSNNESSSSDDLNREIKKINKKLRSIEKLEEKVERGEMLNSEELLKLESRTDYESRLEELNMKLTES
ncbi:uncharacterized protein LOC141909891 [Tubulanus polymorphus]|uniref:uncharacterized protein LOC141909891 n=1 Tax=Tubulanus polymorphus TaxID=672921 RepID=UPI003DA298ED